MNNRVGFAPLLFLFGARIAAQSFADLTDSRNTTNPFSSVFMIEGGAIGTAASPDVTTRGLDDEISWDGRAYFRDEAFGSRRGTLKAYAGRDGLFAGYTDGKLIGDATLTRFEVRAQPWQFYRDGFYVGDELRPNGFYDGLRTKDTSASVPTRTASTGGSFPTTRRRLQALHLTDDISNPTFVIPENYKAYGGRMYIEQNTVQMDRRRGMPRDGYTLTIIGEREWNDSKGVFGTAVFSTELPKAVWRVRGRLEWYIPASDSAVWEINAHGGWQDELDRIENTQAQRPLGNQWADAQVRLRLHLGRSMTVTPFIQGQFSNVTNGSAPRRSRTFIGGGLESYYHFGESGLSLHARTRIRQREPALDRIDRTHGQQILPRHVLQLPEAALTRRGVTRLPLRSALQGRRELRHPGRVPSRPGSGRRSASDAPERRAQTSRAVVVRPRVRRCTLVPSGIVSHTSTTRTRCETVSCGCANRSSGRRRPIIRSRSRRCAARSRGTASPRA
jgi:hypothetical protein